MIELFRRAIGFAFIHVGAFIIGGRAERVDEGHSPAKAVEIPKAAKDLMFTPAEPKPPQPVPAPLRGSLADRRTRGEG